MIRRTRLLAAFVAPAALMATALPAVAFEAQQSRTPARTSAATVASAPLALRPISFSTSIPAASGALVLPLASIADLATPGAGLDAQTRAGIERAVASADFKFGARQTLSLRGVGDWDRILIVGLGTNPRPIDFQNAGTVAARSLISETGPVVILTGGLEGHQAAEIATGAGLGQYRSDLHNSSRANVQTPGVLTIVSDSSDAARFYEGRGAALVEAMAWTRNVSNEPANVIYPESFVAATRAAFSGVRGVTIEVLDVPAMERLGMGAILGVGQGSARPPRMLIVHYRGNGAPQGQPIALIGKGITFDSGGLSIKGSAGMGNMKMDMSGAASVMGATLALARQGAPVNVVAIAALAENMPDGAAMRPADVLTAMNGKTIEIGSTDAEGRLVLADAMAYAEAHIRPAAIVDVATLTGAVGGALGPDYAGLFSRHDALADQLKTAGDATNENLWRLPLHPAYAGRTSSTIADIFNGSEGGPGAGTGAYFIGYFANPETPWAHLDIANRAYSGANDVKPAGSAAFALRLLERFVLDYQPVERGVGTGGY